MINQSVTEHKIVVVLNKKVAIGNVLNAASHLCLGLANKACQKQRQQMLFQQFVNKEGLRHDNISGLSLIVLRARNGEIAKLHEQALQQDILHTTFVETMTGGNYEQQLERTRLTAGADALYYGTALFGPIERLTGLTKKIIPVEIVLGGFFPPNLQAIIIYDTFCVLTGTARR